jgi:DNA-binding MarR family transcriptional regulator
MSTGNPLFLRDEDLDDAIVMVERAQRLFAADVADLLAGKGLGSTHDLVLRLVARRPGVAMVDLKRTIAASKQTLSRVLTELESKGLVVLAQGDSDRRQRPARITEAGQAILAEVDQLRRRRLRRVFRAVGPQAVAGFRQVLDILLDPPTERPASIVQGTFRR